jgi:hypothetical protein
MSVAPLAHRRISRGRAMLGVDVKDRAPPSRGASSRGLAAGTRRPTPVRQGRRDRGTVVQVAAEPFVTDGKPQLQLGRSTDGPGSAVSQTLAWRQPRCTDASRLSPRANSSCSLKSVLQAFRAAKFGLTDHHPSTGGGSGLDPASVGSLVPAGVALNRLRTNSKRR